MSADTAADTPQRDDASRPEGAAGRCSFVDQRLPKALRLRTRREFLRVQDEPAIKLRCASFVLLASPRVEPGPSRFGPVASRRLGGSVQRSRAKRLLRELFRRHRGLFGSGLDFVLVAQGPLLDRDFAGLCAELAALAPLLEKRIARLAGQADRAHEQRGSGAR